MGSQSIPLSRRSLIAMGTGALAVAACAPVGRASNELAVYKTPTCACCTAWVDHMRAAGRVRSGDIALLVGFGAGLSYAGQAVVLP